MSKVGFWLGGSIGYAACQCNGVKLHKNSQPRLQHLASATNQNLLELLRWTLTCL